jgi:geranylgeranyl diphosphate synthase type I
MSGDLRELLEIDQVGSRVTGVLADFLAWQLSSAAPGSYARDLMRPAADLVLGDGKRLRAALCYWGWRATGAPDADAAIAAAAAVEMLHGFALIHDDVMDHSATRRGRPAVHVYYQDAHDRHAWRGSSSDFAVSAAILAGDLCIVWADMILNDAGLSPAARLRGARVYDEMRRATIHGQFLDLVGQSRGDVDPALARAIALGKTASSTTVGPLLFGASLAGASSRVTELLRAFAEPLGLAFQLNDDLLDAFGDQDAAGKPVGQDLRDGKATLLLALARRRGGRATTARIDTLSARGDADAVAELRHLIESTGARRHVEQEIARLTDRAARVVDNGLLPRDVSGLLSRLARAATIHSPTAVRPPAV